VCWRCKTPVEIIPTEQWFVRVDKDKVIDAAQRIKWVPAYMFLRLKDWVEGMEWDWVISRQRIFATPIPVWYCKKCGKIKVAKEEWLPVDPLVDKPPEPCDCGSNEFEGEKDVLDTWMDSSITPLAIIGWPEKIREYPVHLRPQGHDIIRTWAFYTILRSILLVDQIPWNEIVINGMVLGEDGRKMSKSLGNIIEPEDVIEKYGADCLRQWAASGVVGSDLAFAWKEVIAASRFQQKFWSVLRFSLPHLKDYKPNEEDIKYLRDTDRWILSKLNRLIKKVDKFMEEYRFSDALKAIRSFAWYEYADNYIELVKNRLYSGNNEEKRSAKFVLYTVMDSLIRLLAPFTPFLAEECWSVFKGGKSVHLQPYPCFKEEFIDNNAERKGELIKKIVEAVRRYKHKKGLALNAPLRKIEIYTDADIDLRDICGATNSKVELIKLKPKIKTRIKKMTPKYEIIGPMFKERTEAFVKAIEKLPENKKIELVERGKVMINFNGAGVEIKSDWFSVEVEKFVEGKKAEVIEIGSKDIILVYER